MADHPHPQTFTECCIHLAQLLISGKLDDEWKTDPDCIKQCVKKIMNRLMDLWAPDPDLIGASNNLSPSEQEAMAELAVACKCPAAASVDNLSGGLVDMLLPALLRLILAWLEKQS